MKKKKPTGTLWLFSSDNRALYTEDCLSVLALPAGAVHRFRYQRKWTSLEPDVETTDAGWTALVGVDVVVAFVAARSKAYGRAVYVPLRHGTVVRAVAEGDFLFIDFAVGAYADILQAANADIDGRRRSFIALTDELRLRFGGERFPRADYGDGEAGGYSVVLATQDKSELAQSEAEATRMFSAIASVLDDLLSPGASLENSGNTARTIFLRFLGVRRAGKDAGAREGLRGGQYELRSGTEYEADILQVCRTSADGHLTIRFPGTVVPGSATDIRLKTAYDMTTTSFLSSPRENNSKGQIEVEARGDDEGSIPARVTLPLLIRPRRSFSVLNWTIVAASLLTTILVTLLASQGVLWEPPSHGSNSFWILPLGVFVAVSPAALAVSVVAGLLAAAAAAGAVFRRRFGLDANP